MQHQTAWGHADPGEHAGSAAEGSALLRRRRASTGSAAGPALPDVAVVKDEVAAYGEDRFLELEDEKLQAQAAAAAVPAPSVRKKKKRDRLQDAVPGAQQ